MRPDDSVLVWLGKARQDMLALTALRDEPGIEAEILGFHAQQAAEKLLKAVLCALGVQLPRTYRLSDLIDLLADRERPIPPALDEIRFLTPFALQYRYDYVAEQAEPFDARAALAMLRQLESWVQAVVEELG